MIGCLPRMQWLLDACRHLQKIERNVDGRYFLSVIIVDDMEYDEDEKSLISAT